MRAIDADALKDYIDAQEGRPFIGCTVGQALKIMTDEQPTIQPAEPERGKWVLVCDNNGMHFICNKCGAWRYHQEQKFCGECGADMREVTE